MRMRDRFALHLAPIPLRLMLGLVFLWAGLGKVTATTLVQPSDAAVLKNLGVPVRTDEPAPPPPPEPTPEQAEPESEPEAIGFSGDAARIALVSQPAEYTAADFPDESEIMRVHGLVLTMHNAAQQGYDAEGRTTDPYWPAWAADAPLVRYLAWAVAITEIVFGFFMLIGLLTRIGSLALASVMLGALWLTQIGPAIQSGQTILGFLPEYPPFDPKPWTPFLFQFTLLFSAFTLFLLGPGEMSIDALAFRQPDEPEQPRGRADEDDEDEEEEDA